MKTFISEITQLKGLRKYSQTKSIQAMFHELTTEFDSCVNMLNFINTDNIKSRTEHEKEIIDNDLEELNQYLLKIGGGITDEDNNISETVNEINMVKKLILDSRTNREQIQAIIEDQNKLLKLDDFKETDEMRGKKVKKYIRLNDNKSVAFKYVTDESDTTNAKNDIRNHVAILMKLKDYYSGLPKEYKEISRKAVGADPEFRPTLTEMFKILKDLFEPLNPPTLSSKIPYKIKDVPPMSHTHNDNNIQDDNIQVTEIINFAEFNYMTVKEATSTHRTNNGNLEMAFKCLNAYAKLDEELGVKYIRRAAQNNHLEAIEFCKKKQYFHHLDGYDP
ncbi:3901_t:CDS:2 [Racocetra fulgida]|uniref:3901_t:CDS:1 n=1 Tax=Racocetra fulgida TaxID=60492 RepID=A0A9N8ZA39_9GLOM|nr:3901_t:CDS:2 [Racocetra fulgida]